MKFAHIRYDGEDRVVVRFDDAHLVGMDTLLGLTESGYGNPACKDMAGVIRAGQAFLTEIDAALENFTQHPDHTKLIPVAAVSWYPPVRNPGKICGIAMNNSASNKRKISAPDHPAFFMKPASCLAGHEQVIRIRPYYGSVHPEPELCVIIGRETRDVPAVDAIDSIFGYSIFNDITGNGMRAEDMFHYWALYAKKDNPSLSSESVSYFKEIAKANHIQYQKMIRQLLDEYVAHQKSANK